MYINKPNVFFPTAENLVSINPRLNDVVAVYSKKYNGCYRAKVKQNMNDSAKFFKCILIDIGSHDNIPSQYIFELPNDYTVSQIWRK